MIIVTVCLMFYLSPAYAKKNKENSREIKPHVEKEKSIKEILNDWVDAKIITPGLKFEEKTGNRWSFISRMTKKTSNDSHIVNSKSEERCRREVR